MSKVRVINTKQTVRFGVRLLCFLILIGLILGYALYVLTPKYEYGVCPMNNLYAQPKDSVDVLAVGTSQIYSGINTNVLWSRYGITAYNLCSAEQTFWISYYVIKEALKMQHPKVILLDVKPASYIGSYSRHARVILSSFGIRGLDNRFGAIRSCVQTSEEAMDYILGIPAVHSNVEGLTAADFVYPLDNNGRGSSWKGYIETDGTNTFQRAAYDDTVEAKKLNARAEEYLRKTIEMVQEAGIELILIAMPYPDYTEDQPYQLPVWEIAEEYGVTVMDFNQKSLRGAVYDEYDFADYQHLNIRGSVNLSVRLGTELRRNYSLEDHRGDAYYESYDTCAKIWYDSHPDYGKYP